MDEPIEFHEYNEIKPRMSFSQRELRDIFVAWLVLSLAFALVISNNSSQFSFQTALIAALITVGTGFVLHELAHRFVALKFGAMAE
ncbi:MAG: metalloprotease, partial [archaeon]|nr:metalloprotease [archaeon]